MNAPLNPSVMESTEEEEQAFKELEKKCSVSSSADEETSRVQMVGNLMIGGGEIPLCMIREGGTKYYLPDTGQMVFYTGKPHGENGNVHVCALGTGQTFYVAHSRLRNVIPLK